MEDLLSEALLGSRPFSWVLSLGSLGVPSSGLKGELGPLLILPPKFAAPTGSAPFSSPKSKCNPLPVPRAIGGHALHQAVHDRALAPESLRAKKISDGNLGGSTVLGEKERVRFLFVGKICLTGSLRNLRCLTGFENKSRLGMRSASH